MKVYFKDDVSFKNIIQTIEKMQISKEIIIEIDPNNAIFDDYFLGRHMITIINTRGLNVTFTASTKYVKEYYQKIGANVIVNKGLLFKQYFESFNNFFLKARDAQVGLFEKKNYFSYIVVMTEIVIVLYAFYWFYSFIKPSADIYIKPAYTLDEIIYNFRFYPSSDSADTYSKSKFITSNYYEGVGDIYYDLSSEVENIIYSQIPSKGKVKIINEGNNDYSLIANTTFATEDGLVFKAKNWFYVPAKKDYKGEIIVDLEADIKDEFGNIMGARGNILSGTKLYIRKLNDSNFKKIVYGVSVGDFTGGEKTGDGSISQNDIDILTGKLLNHIQENKKRLLIDSIKDENVVILPFSDLFKLDTYNFIFSGNVGDKVDTVHGTINAKISYKYLKRNEFESGIMKYINDRQSDVADLLEISRSSLIFYEKEMVGKIMIVPTKIEAIRGYDFDKDINGIKNGLIDKIVGLNKQQAQDQILQHSEIDVAVIEINPPWYNLVPSLKSRIKIHLTQ